MSQSIAKPFSLKTWSLRIISALILAQFLVMTIMGSFAHANTTTAVSIDEQIETLKADQARLTGFALLDAYTSVAEKSAMILDQKQEVNALLKEFIKSGNGSDLKYAEISDLREQMIILGTLIVGQSQRFTKTSCDKATEYVSMYASTNSETELNKTQQITLNTLRALCAK